MICSIFGIVLIALPIVAWFLDGGGTLTVEGLATVLFFWFFGIIFIIAGADKLTTEKKLIVKDEKLSYDPEKKHWSMISEYDNDGKRVKQILTVRCPNRNSEFSEEFSEECKKCGIIYAKQRSLGYCEYIFQEMKSLQIDTRKHSAEKHDIRNLPSINETEIRYGMDLRDTIKFQHGIAKGSRGKYFEILDFHIGRYVYGAGFQPEYLLKCLLCHETFLAYSDLTSSFNQGFDLRCLY